MDEVTGWWTLEFVNNRIRDVNIASAIRGIDGSIQTLVTHDKIYYNFNNVLSMKRKKD